LISGNTGPETPSIKKICTQSQTAQFYFYIDVPQEESKPESSEKVERLLYITVLH
jgi:hypothetical protein